MTWKKILNKQGRVSSKSGHFDVDRKNKSIILSKQGAGSKDKEGLSKRAALSFRIGRDIASEYRLLIGDRAEILIDEENRKVMISRVQSGGFAVSCGNGKKFADMKGTVNTCTVKFTDSEEMVDSFFFNKSGYYIAEDVEITPDGIVFGMEPIPKPHKPGWTSL